MKKSIARSGKRFVERMLFEARRMSVEKQLDPRRDSTLISWATYSPWLLDAEFQRCHAEVRANTLVDLFRCYELWHLLGQASHLEGDVLEVGTWKGGTGCLLARRAAGVAPGSTVFLCDTFEGVIKTSDADPHYGGGEHADASEAVVLDLAKRMGLGNLRILKGAFPDDTGAEVEERRFRFCHIDVDAYRSGKDVFDWVWPRMPVGGMVVFDDFGFSTTQGITRLVHELEPRTDLVGVENLNGHSVLIKTV